MLVSIWRVIHATTPTTTTKPLFSPLPSQSRLLQYPTVPYVRWYSAVENACLKAEMELDKLVVWQGGAMVATKGAIRQNTTALDKGPT